MTECNWHRQYKQGISRSGSRQASTLERAPSTIFAADRAGVSASNVMVALSPFHLGEQAVQLKTGGAHMRDAIEQMGSRVVRDYMPQQHRDFFSNQPLLYFAAQDPATGTVWASVLAGPRGFISSPTSQILSIAGPAHLAGDPAAGCLAVGSRIGMLGLELTSRRRNRLNGTLMAQQDDGLLIAVDQSFGNCPKYIQARQVELDSALLQHMSTQVPGVVQHGSGDLGPEQIGLISAADTFFLATSSSRSGRSNGSAGQRASQPDSHLIDESVPAFASGLTPLPNKPTACGLDVSHRGGAPGFVVVSRDGKSLRWPDYTGNDMFNSFGNLAINPTAGLLFIDWSTGDTLQLTGTAAVHYGDTSLPGGKRTVVFEVDTWRHAYNALPIKDVTFVSASPYNPPVLRPAASSQGGAAAGEWLTCTDVVVEADGIKSYFFEASAAMRAATAAGKLPYQPGQYASFDFQPADLKDQHNQAAPAASAATSIGGVSQNSTPGQAAAAAAGVVVNRTWTISSHPADTAATGQFSITVKRIGLVSGYLWDRMRPGGRVLFRGVGGVFTLEGCTQRPLLLVAGGIGITPLRSMFQECIKLARPVTLIYSVSQAAEAAFLDELIEAANTANEAASKHIAPPSTAAAAAAETGVTEDSAAATVPPSVGPAYQVHLLVTRGAEGLQSGSKGVPGRTGSTAAASLPLVRHHQGRLTAAVLKQLVPDSTERCVFLCGPASFMDAVTNMCVRELGHTREPETESFNY